MVQFFLIRDLENFQGVKGDHYGTMYYLNALTVSWDYERIRACTQVSSLALGYKRDRESLPWWFIDAPGMGQAMNKVIASYHGHGVLRDIWP